MQLLLVTIMRTQRHDRDIDFKVVNFIDHAIMLVDAARLRLFKDEMLQVFYLARSCARVLLQLQKHVGNLLDGSLVATFLNSGKF